MALDGRPHRISLPLPAPVTTTASGSWASSWLRRYSGSRAGPSSVRGSSTRAGTPSSAPATARASAGPGATMASRGTVPALVIKRRCAGAQIVPAGVAQGLGQRLREPHPGIGAPSGPALGALPTATGRAASPHVLQEIDLGVDRPYVRGEDGLRPGRGGPPEGPTGGAACPLRGPGRRRGRGASEPDMSPAG